MFRYELVNSTTKFTIVAEIVSLLKQIYKRDDPFRAVFKVKTLAVLFSAYPREMKHIPRNLNLPPFWRLLVSIEMVQFIPTRTLSRARGLSMHTHLTAVELWNNQFPETKILGLPASRRMRGWIYMASRDKVDVATFQKGIQYALEKVGKSKFGFECTTVSSFKSKRHEGSGNELVDYSRAQCLRVTKRALHTAAEPAVRSAVKILVSQRNDTIKAFFFAANKNKNSAQVPLASTSS